jgi:hypothetical protein
MAVFTDEQQRSSSGGLKMRRMGPVQVDPGLCQGRGHCKVEKVAGTRREDSSPGNFQLAKSGGILTHGAILEDATRRRKNGKWKMADGMRVVVSGIDSFLLDTTGMAA